MPAPLPPADQVTIHISTCARRSDREKWGDTAFAEALARAIRNLGHKADLFFSGEMPSHSGAGDVVLRIAGPHLDDTVPGVPNLVWLISLPAYVSHRALARFQTVFTASAALTRQYALEGLPAKYLPQATDPDLFNPKRRPPDAELLPLVFVGNHGIRATRRLIKAVAALPGSQLSVWGDGWKGEIPDRFIRGTHLPHADLPALYARSRIVLNSHMNHMAQLGMMSNRSFDALAAGALVLSDRVQGFSAPDLPDLIQIDDLSKLESWLHTALDAPPASQVTRDARNAQIRRAFSFEARAAAIVNTATQLLSLGVHVPYPFTAHTARRETSGAKPVTLEMRDDAAPDNQHPVTEAIQTLDQALAAGPVILRMRLSDPASMPGIDSLPLAMLRAALAVRQILDVIARRTRLSGLELVHDAEGCGTGIIHPMMPDLRKAQALLKETGADVSQEAAGLALRAQRVIDQLLSPGDIGPILQPRRLTDADLVGVLRNQPLYRRDGPGNDLNPLKTHVALWPRRAPTTLSRPVGVFLHLYHAELAGLFAERLARIDAPIAVYVSTDTALKADQIAVHLPQAQIRVMPNRGRDIAPKFVGFRDAHSAHDIVLHLHGKRSTHARKLDGWMSHILDCLLPAPEEINRILSFFKDIDRIGIIAPQAYRPTLRSSHWAHDIEIAEELRFRLDLPAPLPDDDSLNFPAGSMFWARRTALQPLLDLPLSVSNFPPEAQQIDGTLAHATERMIGVVCLEGGFELMRVAPNGDKTFPKHKLMPASNAELRDWLERPDQTRRNEA